MKTLTARRTRVTCALAFAVFVVTLVVAQNPVPTVTNPVMPQAVTPGSPGFTLTVRGANFVPGAIVNWNGTPRNTTYVSSDELQAQIGAADVSVATAGFITVTNPGGRASSASFGTVEVSVPRAALTVGRPKHIGDSENGIYSAVLADLNGDGNLDLAETTVGYINVALGQGDGTFTAKSRNLTPIGAYLAVGDFNNDGLLDFASASNRLRTYLGDGSGKFLRFGGSGSQLTQQNLQLAVADFNQDGNLDVAVGDNLQGLAVFKGNGDGTFLTQQSYPITQALDVVTADLDGDGKLDLVVHGFNSSGAATLSVLLGNGDGTFNLIPDVAVFTSVATTTARNLFLNDFNHDGKWDVLVGEQGGVEILLGNGDGTFGAPAFYSSGYTQRDHFAIDVGDFTSDGNTDVILSDNLSSQFGMLAGNPDGTLV